MYVAWGAFYEGESDRAYFEALLPRLMEEIALSEGNKPVTIPVAPAVQLGKKGREVRQVATEICASSNAFHVVFVHADAGGRALEAGVDQRSVAYCQAAQAMCGWDPARCIVLKPRHETEAWVLADSGAVTAALGYSGSPRDLGLPNTPAAAERLVDPKLTLATAVEAAQGRKARRGGSQVFGTIAQTQSFASLRGSRSFREFETQVRAARQSLGIIDPPSP